MEPTRSNISWGYDDLLFFLVLSTLSIFVSQILVSFAASLLRTNAKGPFVVFAAQLLVYSLVFTVLFALIKLQYGRQFWPALAWNPSKIVPGAAFLLGLALSFATQLLAVALRTPDIDTPIKNLLSKPNGLLAFGVLAVTLGPLCEELVFRGFVQPLLVRSLGALPGIVLTACVFGSLHLAQNGFVWQTGLLITLAGAAFGWMREWTGSTKAATWMHAGFNSTIFLLFLQQSQKVAHPQ